MSGSQSSKYQGPEAVLECLHSKKANIAEADNKSKDLEVSMALVYSRAKKTIMEK